jgi:hypothetical protein
MTASRTGDSPGLVVTHHPRASQHARPVQPAASAVRERAYLPPIVRAVRTRDRADDREVRLRGCRHVMDRLRGPGRSGNSRAPHGLASSAAVGPPAV